MIWWLELFFLSILERSDKCQCTGRFWAHFRATDFAAPILVTVWNSVDEFQALAMRLVAKVLLPGTGWVAFAQLMDIGPSLPHDGRPPLKNSNSSWLVIMGMISFILSYQEVSKWKADTVILIILSDLKGASSEETFLGVIQIFCT